MSSGRHNLSLFVEHPSPSSNRAARGLQMPNLGSYEISKENHPSGHDGPMSGSSYKYQKTPSGTLLAFQGSRMNGLAEKYEHPEHVPIFLDFDEKTGSLHHIDRQEGRARLDTSRRKGSLLPDDEFESIRMTFPARSDPGFSKQTATRNTPALVPTPPPQATARSYQHSEGPKSPRPRGPRAPSRVASSAQLRTTPIPPSARQHTKSAANNSELYSGLASFHPIPVPPRRNEAVETASPRVRPDKHWDGVYERKDACVPKDNDIPSDPKIKGRIRSLFKKRT